MKCKLWFLPFLSFLLLINCTRNEVNKLNFKDSAYIKFIAENSFDSLSITSRDCSFFPMTACLPNHIIIKQRGDYYVSFRISKPELFSVHINSDYFVYLIPGDTLVIKLFRINNEKSINVVINDPIFVYFQNEYKEFGANYFRSPFSANYYNSKPISKKELESAISAIDSETNNRLEFLNQNANKIPSWFAETQRAEYLYMAAHLKFFQYFLFYEKNLYGSSPFIDIKLNDPKAKLSGYYFLFLSDYFLLPFLDNEDTAIGPSLMINLYNKASKNIQSKLKGEVLKCFHIYLLVTLYNASVSKEDIAIVDKFTESHNFNLSQSEHSFINFEKSEVNKRLQNKKERSNNLILENVTFQNFTDKSSEKESSGKISAIQDTVYSRVEENPEFIGGIDAFNRFIKKNLNYPNQCKEAGIQGRVLIMITVEKDGTISNPRVLRSANTYLDDEALRIANLLPKFKPGMNKGVPVRVEIVMPIDFEL